MEMPPASNVMPFADEREKFAFLPVDFRLVKGARTIHLAGWSEP